MIARTMWAVAAMAAATLLLEGALTRFLAVAQFYHFAFLVVSLALLGFGASGSLLTVFPRLHTIPAPDNEGQEKINPYLLPLAGFGFALSVGLAYLVVNILPFDSYSIAWERRQIGYFALYYLFLTLPFLFAGLGIGGGLAAAGEKSHLVYAANLFGSGLGALLALGALQLAGVPGAVLASALVAWCALFPGLNLITRPVWRGLAIVSTVFFMAGFVALSALNAGDRSPMGMATSPYKGLPQALRYPGSTLVFSRWNAVSRVDIVAGAGTRQLPGLSYVYPGAPPSQVGLAVDADAILPVNLSGPETFEPAGYLPEAIAFQLRPQARVLVLEPGGGLGVQQALAGQAASVTAVLGNALIRQGVASVAGKVDAFADPRVHTVIEMPRVFTHRDRDVYDLVFLPLTDPYRPVTSGAYSLAETYELTVEAFQAKLARLAPGGILVSTRWIQLPPSEDLRLIATLLHALEGFGIPEPAEVLVAFRGIQTMTVLVNLQGWSESELAEIRDFVAQRRYDLVWMPNIQAEETNRFNRLPESYYYQAVWTLLQTDDRPAFYRDYPFDIAPRSDDQPFFFHFFKWSQTPELIATFGRTWQPFGGSGYFVLLALLALVSLLSLVLILLPMLILGSRRAGPPGASPEKNVVLKPDVKPDLRSKAVAGRGWVLAFFGLLGLAFLFVEIPLIQRVILLVGHPVYAFTLVVVVLLTLSAVGSVFARHRRLPRRLVFAILVVMALLTPWLVNQLTSITLGWPLGSRLVVTSLSLAPLSMLMGMPFPLGLAWLQESRRHAESAHLIPWAWAINGCASVISAVLAAILALSFGFSLVLSLGAGAYAGAGLLWWRSGGR
jgi:hypothetical protein